MFGLVERGRLAMYEKTLSTAKRDVASQRYYVPGIEDALGIFQEAVSASAHCAYDMDCRETLFEAISAIPSSLLSDIDLILLRVIRPPASPNDEAAYYMASLLHGLIYVRIVEVTQPNLRPRAHAFRDAALSFLEPIYRTCLTMMRLKTGAMLSCADAAQREEKLEAERQVTIDEAVRVGLAAARRYGS